MVGRILCLEKSWVASYYFRVEESSLEFPTRLEKLIFTGMIQFETWTVSPYVEALRLLSNTRIETSFDCDPNSSIHLEAKFSDCSSSTEGGQRH